MPVKLRLYPLNSSRSVKNIVNMYKQDRTKYLFLLLLEHFDTQRIKNWDRLKIVSPQIENKIIKSNHNAKVNKHESHDKNVCQTTKKLNVSKEIRITTYFQKFYTSSFLLLETFEN